MRKSLKAKLIISVILIVVATGIAMLVSTFLQSSRITKEVVSTATTNELEGGCNMLESFISNSTGEMTAKDGQLLDKDGADVVKSEDMLDEFASDMGVVATLFAKDGSDYIRIATTIKDGEKRVVGTPLDTTGAAYAAIGRGEPFYGEANILGTDYMTGYKPIKDASGQVIGIYFTGIPMTEINGLIEGNEKKTLTSTVALGAVIMLLAAAVIYIVSMSIVKPIVKLRDAAQEIANGNFDVNVEVTSKDEVGQLQQAFSETTEKLQDYQGYIDETASILQEVSDGNFNVVPQRAYEGQFRKLKDNLESLLTTLSATMRQINEMTMQVDAGAEQISNGAQALAQGSTEQASSVETVSAGIGDITNAIHQSADNAASAQENADSAQRELQNSNDMMKQMVAAMETIDKKSAEIQKIVKMIDDIAFQTNILSLNASVEAARAGEAGKGFAVVAGEVGNLAKKSADAVKSTTALIDETIAAVKNGSEIVQKTAESMQKSSEVTEKVTVLMKQIAEASEQEANEIAQINESIDQISKVVQTNAATAEESAAASEELTGQSGSLKEMIGKFRLKEG